MTDRRLPVGFRLLWGTRPHAASSKHQQKPIKQDGGKEPDEQKDEIERHLRADLLKEVDWQTDATVTASAATSTPPEGPRRLVRWRKEGTHCSLGRMAADWSKRSTRPSGAARRRSQSGAGSRSAAAGSHRLQPVTQGVPHEGRQGCSVEGRIAACLDHAAQVSGY